MHPIFVQYEAKLVRTGKTSSSFRAIRGAARTLEQVFPGRDPFTVEPWEWEEAWEALPCAPATKGQWIRFIRAAIHYAQKRGMDIKDPTGLVEIRIPHREPDTLSNADLRKFKAAVRTPFQYRLWLGLVYTGMRYSELRALRPWDVDLRRQRIHVIGKGNKERWIPLHPTLAEDLVRMRVDRPVFGYVKRETLNCFAPGHGFHIFRRTMASSLADNDVDSRVIDSIMGWSPRSVAGRHYVKVSEEKKMQAICRLYANDPV